MQRVIVWHRWAPPAEPSREAAAVAALWRIAARERFLRADAEVLLELGGTAVFGLEVGRIARALEICLSVTRDAAREEASLGALTCGVAVGPVEQQQAAAHYATFVGDVLDRAQALANAAGPHEIVLDAAAQAAASGAFLYARELSVGEGIRAAVLDRAFPRKSDCQRGVTQLDKPPVLALQRSQYEALRQLAHGTGRHRVVLVGPHGIGIRHWVTRLADELAPPAWLDVRPLGASIAPLSGLMFALRRLVTSASPEHVLSGSEEADEHARATLLAVREGYAVSRRDAVLSLRQYIGRASESGKRAIISVDPAPMIDPSTVGVVAEAARENGPDVLVVMRLLLESKPPEAFARGGGLSEIRVQGFTPAEARAFAATMLRSDPDDEIARRAAAIGGSQPLAIAEALRVLIASGDVVVEEGAFRWRRGPAARLESMGLEALIEERIDALAAPFRRALELLATVPDPDDRALCAEVAAADGLLPETWEQALDELDALSFLSVDSRGLCLSPVVRSVAQSTMAPARMLDVNHAVARALAARTEARHGFALATYAFYLARSGNMPDAAALFLEVAAQSGQLGFVRSGVRLAAAAVECDPSPETRTRAAQIAERLSDRSSRASSPQVARASRPSSPEPTAPPRESLGGEARKRAVEAILARDFDEVERAIELLVAADRDGPSVDRLRTLTLLAKGDHRGALELLARLREREVAEESPKYTLTEALVAIATGQLEPAVRSSLSALARTREAQDPLGERAALSVLSMCFQRLGRAADADRLARAALDTGAVTQ